MAGCVREERGESPAHSNAYSTAIEQASFSLAASSPCCRKLCRVEKVASQAGHECSPRELMLVPASDERDRLDE